jgi:hypothetical protein
MGAKTGSAAMTSPDELPGRPQGGRSRRRTRGVAPVVRPTRGNAAADLAILNRNARRLNREAREVLSFQVPV